MLKIKKSVYDHIIEHVKNAYPHECCGVLVGHIQGETKLALKSYPIENLNRERARDRYNMDPVGFIKVEKQIAQEGLEIVGIYHSHPDHPPRPSKTDLEYAWAIYSYIIVAVAGGTQIEAKNWCLNDSGDEFLEEPYEVVDVSH
jgi:proteasome lid subunit RPN8/RPN11